MEVLRLIDTVNETLGCVCLRRGTDNEAGHSLGWGHWSFGAMRLENKQKFLDRPFENSTMVREGVGSKSYNFIIFRENSTAIEAVISQQMLWRLKGIPYEGFLPR